MTAPLGWFRALRHHFTIRSDDQGLSAAAAAAFGDLLATSEVTSVEYLALSHPDGLHLSVDGESAGDWSRHGSCTRVDCMARQSACGRLGPDRLVLHAGAVVLDGVTVIAAGESGAGKSTLVTALLRDGASYLTDEAVAIDVADLSVARFAKPLSLHPASARLVPSELIDPHRTDEQLVRASGFATVASDPGPPPGMLTIVRHQPGDGTRFEPMTPAEMVFRLARLTFDFTADVQRNLTGLAAITTTAGCGQVVTDEIIEAADTIRAAANHQRTADRHPPVATQTDGLIMVELDGEAVIHVMSTGALHHLDPISREVWSTMRQGRPLSDLAAELTTRYETSRDQIDRDVRGVADRLIDGRILVG